MPFSEGKMKHSTSFIAWIVLFGVMASMLCRKLETVSAVNVPSSLDNKLVKQIVAEPPPLGWSSWNSFSNTINSEIVMKQAKAMVDSGMKRAGFQYVNIDEGWWLGQRDTAGNIVVEAKQWPALEPGERAGDMSNIVRYIHSLGLKAGIYTDAGEAGCGFYGPDLGPPMPHTGAEGHYEQDFLQFAQWGFDYVKVDWCGGNKENLDPAVQYAEIGRAINRAEESTAHRLYFSICNWGNSSPWTWAPGIAGVPGDIWRTSGDIVAPIVANSPNASRMAEFKNVLGNFDLGIHPEAQHTGYYNDPDMMVFGMAGLNETQNRVHLSLWAISGAPLLVGADLTKLASTQIAMLTNPDVLGIDQDGSGLQGVKVSERGKDLQTWCKILASPGARAVLLLNRGASAADMSVAWDEIGLDGSAATVKDVWAGKELGLISKYSTRVAAGDAVLLLMHGRDASTTTYATSTSSTELRGDAKLDSCKACASGHSAVLGGKREVRFNVLAIQRPTIVRIRYLNTGRTPLMAQLRPDGRAPTNILFPAPEVNGQIGTVTVEVEPGQGGQQSTLSFSSHAPVGPALESIAVLALGR
jgi:hypothetical protein